jgi:YD repeat-containing protein
VLQKCLDESWIEFDANGDLTDNSFPKEAVSVDAIGDFTHQKSDGSMLEHWSDGTKIETDIGGVSVTTNPDGSRAMLHWGRAYLVTHPNGGTRSFDYDEDGNLFKIHESQTGLAFEKQGDTWYKYLDVNEQGLSPENILDEFTGTVQVDVTGRVRIATAGKKTTIYPDGRWVNG